MRAWIRKLIGQPAMDLRQVYTAEKGNLRVEVHEYRKRCGHPGHLVELLIKTETDSGKEGRLSLACIGWEDLQTGIELMQEASDEIAAREGFRPLPTVRLWGKTFFVDERLSELRNVNDPTERVGLSM